AEAVEHAQGLADAGAADAEPVREIAFGRKRVADCQRTGHDLLLDGVDDQLIGVRPGHGSPGRTRGRLGAVRSLLRSLVPVLIHGLSHPAIMSCPSSRRLRAGGSRPQDHLTQLTYRFYSHINGLTSLRS